MSIFYQKTQMPSSLKQVETKCDLWGVYTKLCTYVTSKSKWLNRKKGDKWPKKITWMSWTLWGKIAHVGWYRGVFPKWRHTGRTIRPSEENNEWVTWQKLSIFISGLVKQQSKCITLLLNPCCLSADATILHDRIRTTQNLHCLII